MFSYRWSLLGVICIALIGAIALNLSAFDGKPHLAGINCGKCHLSNSISTPEQARMLVASQEVICGSCHAKALQVSHPSGFTPRNKLPAEYPADWKGALTCSSCHEIHGSKPQLLRGDKRGEQMCLSCHNRAFFDQMKDTGTSIQQMGHLSKPVAPGEKIEIDAMSLQCLSCHAGQADAGGVRVDRSGVMYHASGAANHPIAMPYPLFPSTGTLRPRSMLSKKILLPEGKVSCVSCHEAYKKQHGKLVMPNDNSALCIQCHNL